MLTSDIAENVFFRIEQKFKYPSREEILVLVSKFHK